MQSSPPNSYGKARTIRELSRSLSHSPRNIPSPSPAPSDSNPTKHSGFGTDTDNFFDDPDFLMSTQHKIEDDTNTLPQYPRIRSTAKKINTWQMLRSEQPLPDTSMVNKEFGNFDHSISDDEVASVEQARGGSRSNRATPSKMSSQFNSLYDITPPTNRTRKSYAAETGSLRRDAALRRASRNDLDTASPRPSSKRNSPALNEYQGRKPASLAHLHAKLSADESSFMDHRPATVTVDSTKNTRWGNRSRHTSLQIDGAADSRSGVAHTATGQSFILPDLPNLTELVSGVFEDGTPVISKTIPARSRFSAPPNGGRRPPQHIPVEGVPIPQEEKAIFAALQQLQDKLSQMEHERTQMEKKNEEQDMELIELRATLHAQEKLQRSDSAQGSDAGKGNWKVEKTKLDATIQTLRTKFDRAERKIAVVEIEKKRLNNERDDMAAQLSVAFQTCEELKTEKNALSIENEGLREEVDALRAENEALRQQLEEEHSQHREETMQLRRQFDQTANATERNNATLQAELERIRAQHDDHTQQLARKNKELQKARQEKADFDQLKRDHETLRSQLADLKAKREKEVKRWTQQEAVLKAQVDRRDETIRNFQDMTQEETNEAMRQDNENLRRELAELAEQQHHDNEQWTRREAEMKRKIKERHNTTRRTSDMTREPGILDEAEDYAEDNYQRNSNFRRENTRTRIKSRVQQELHNSRVAEASQPLNDGQDGPRKPYSGVASKLQHEPHPHRSFSAPSVATRNARVDSEVESTTDLSLAPRGTPHTRQNAAPEPATVRPPVDLDLTELSFINGAQIAKLRRALEEERAASRRRAPSASRETEQRDETVRSQRQSGEYTTRSAVSTNSQGQTHLRRKSSMKDNTQRTNVTQFEEDATGDLSNYEADAEPTQTKQSAVDLSMLSNTSRRRRSAPTEMTSAFIVPDIKLDSQKYVTMTTEILHKSRQDHDNKNCTVCRREGVTTSTAEDLRVPKLVPVSSRMPDDVDATLRPARPPREALALVVKELKDERAHLHMELAVMRAMLESHDVSLGNRKRREINNSIHDVLRRLEIKDTQIYNLYDVLEGQKENELTELDVENITEQIRAEASNTQTETEKKAKKVTIRSFIDDDSFEVGRGAEEDMEDITEELPWEGFEETGLGGM